MPAARILLWRDLPGPEAALPAIDAIFFQASNTQSFASDVHRREFRERWLGRFLRDDAAHAYVALGPDNAVIGYLVGSFDDPARTPRFADIGYFAGLAEVTRLYPAHLHVNLATAARGRGVGSALVRTFVASVAGAGLPGVHVVTGAKARNVDFYHRLDFSERRRFAVNGHDLVLLGCDLTVRT